MCLIITIIGVPTNKQNQGIIYNEVIMCYRVLQSSLTWCPVTWVHYWNHASITLYNHLHDRPLGLVTYTLPSIPRLGRASNGDHSRSLATTWQPPVIASRAYSQQSPTCTRVNQMYLIPIALVCIHALPVEEAWSTGPPHWLPLLFCISWHHLYWEFLE